MSKRYFFLALLFSSLPSWASFIESSIGTAVVEDATATYYNPASLTSLKNTQFIALGSLGNSKTQFSGQSTQLPTGFTQSGKSNAQTAEFLPSLYFSTPFTDNIRLGLALVANDLSRNIDEHSILRYSQSSNQIQDIDLVPAVGFKLNEFVSVGVGLNRSRAHFILQPITGLPNSAIADAQSHNESWGDGWGGDVGLFLKPAKSTTMGFNYRSAITYGMKGKSAFNGSSRIISNGYRFDYWTPARYVFSINQFLTAKLALVGTVQYIEWSIFKDVTLHNVATVLGILPTSKNHYNFHDTWLITLGSNYRISPKWIIRGAASYTQSPSNGKFQLDTGDSLTLGASLGYTMTEHVIIDCSYAHAFIKNRPVHLATAQHVINGINKGERNAFALKLTVTS